MTPANLQMILSSFIHSFYFARRKYLISSDQHHFISRRLPGDVDVIWPSLRSQLPRCTKKGFFLVLERSIDRNPIGEGSSPIVVDHRHSDKVSEIRKCNFSFESTVILKETYEVPGSNPEMVNSFSVGSIT